MSRGRQERLTKEQAAHRDELIQAGFLSDTEIARFLGCAKATVQVRRKRLLGLMPKVTSPKRPRAEVIDKTKAVMPVSKSEWLQAPTRERLMGGR